MTSHTTLAASSMNNSSLLKGKHAVVFSAGGSIGAAVAKEFAAEGAEVFLAGRSKSSVELPRNATFDWWIFMDGAAKRIRIPDPRITNS